MSCYTTSPAPAAATDDLLGTAMREFALGSPAPVYLRTAHGRTVRHDLATYFTPPSRLDPAERALLRLARGTVLDVGCGPARHARFLQAQGIPVLGLDRSAGVLEVAHALGLRHGLHADALTGPLPDGVDTALLLDGNLGLAGSLHGTRVLLARLAAACAPGGRLLIAGRAPAGAPARRLVLRVEYRDAVGPWFAWLQLGVTAVAAVAAGTGWRLETVIHNGQRYRACLRRRGWSA